MRPLAREEIVPLAAYAGVRDSFRSAVIAHKRARRLAVGPNVTLVFEDRETLRFQVQEMLWVERIAEPERVQHELDVYNELMPGPNELSATLFVEITEPGRIRAELDRLVGIDEHVALVLGGGEDQRALGARFDTKQMEEDRISAVQYIRFALDEAAVVALAEPGCHAAIRVSHPNYAHEAELPPPLRASLVAGLAADPRPLVPPLPTAGPAREPEVLYSSGGVRVIRPLAPQLPGHLVVESSAPLTSAGEIDPVLWNALSEAVRRTASDAAQRHGGCRVVADFAPGAPLRWHILPRPGGAASN
jgi:diadenosine tetraphosphate (Ap4A) HIT family hydrolase